MDSVEIALMNAGFDFISTCQPKPDEGLTQRVQVDDAVWGFESVHSNPNFVRCSRLDGQHGDQAKYVDSLVKIHKIDMSSPANQQLVERLKRL